VPPEEAVGKTGRHNADPLPGILEGLALPKNRSSKVTAPSQFINQMSANGGRPLIIVGPDCRLARNRLFFVVRRDDIQSAVNKSAWQ